MSDGGMGGYPVTVWERLREGLLIHLFMTAAAGLVLGALLGNVALEMVTAYGAGVAMVLYVAALVLEFRADARYDRSHPEAERDDA